MIAKSALAGLLAILLLSSVIFAASPVLHQCLHQDSAGENHLCVICLLAHGQISASETATFVLVFIAAIFYLAARAELPAPGFVRYRLSQSRAPPSR